MELERQLEIEDYLQEQGVFVSGVSGKKAHSDSYMTVVEPEKVKVALEADFDWMEFKKQVLGQPNTSIAMKVFCAFIQEKGDALQRA